VEEVKVSGEIETKPNETIEAYTGNHIGPRVTCGYAEAAISRSLDIASIKSRDESPNRQMAMVLTGQKPMRINTIRQRAPRNG